MEYCSNLKAFKHPGGLKKSSPSLVIKDLICKVSGVHLINSKVFSSYNDSMVVILMTKIIMSKLFTVLLTTLLLVLNDSKNEG